jgi:hypothetical protein
MISLMLSIDPFLSHDITDSPQVTADVQCEPLVNEDSISPCQECNQKDEKELLVSRPCEHRTMCKTCYAKKGLEHALLQYRLGEMDADGYDCPCCGRKVAWMLTLENFLEDLKDWKNWKEKEARKLKDQQLELTL